MTRSEEGSLCYYYKERSIIHVQHVSPLLWLAMQKNPVLLLNDLAIST
jgi:hypothetical protein